MTTSFRAPGCGEPRYLRRGRGAGPAAAGASKGTHKSGTCKAPAGPADKQGPGWSGLSQPWQLSHGQRLLRGMIGLRGVGFGVMFGPGVLLSLGVMLNLEVMLSPRMMPELRVMLSPGGMLSSG